MPYIIKNQSARWVDPSEGYVLQADESFADIPPEYVAPEPTYRELRAPLYPPVKDGLDAIVKGGQALEDWKAACMAVKALIPKTGS